MCVTPRVSAVTSTCVHMCVRVHVTDRRASVARSRVAVARAGRRAAAPPCQRRQPGPRPPPAAAAPRAGTPGGGALQLHHLVSVYIREFFYHKEILYLAGSGPASPLIVGSGLNIMGISWVGLYYTRNGVFEKGTNFLYITRKKSLTYIDKPLLFAGVPFYGLG